MKRLRGQLRLVVGFPAPGIVVGLLLGAHSQEQNVYEELYALLGVQPPKDGYAQRDKPDCCDRQDDPPRLDPETRAIVDALVPELGR
ncbi:hypothetical protein [Miltoncostaea oceani]|uniref:hypothetical protein n=1 Tax=Miltoncostaea oceani TaxID=2843216 RepID=UPI001C3E1CEC|nr:hypothetical protein [Miltoncostaea oceani]